VTLHYRESGRKRGSPWSSPASCRAIPRSCSRPRSRLPEGFEEIAFAGLLRGKPTRMVRAKTIDVAVPADAEIVLEGVVRRASATSKAPSAITLATTRRRRRPPSFRSIKSRGDGRGFFPPRSPANPRKKIGSSAKLRRRSSCPSSR